MKKAAAALLSLALLSGSTDSQEMTIHTDDTDSITIPLDKIERITVKPQTAIPAGGLIRNYAFNGTARDESGNGKHAEIFGATAAADRFGYEKSAFEFDGTDASRNVIDCPTLGTWGEELSISLWIYPANLSAENGNMIIGSKKTPDSHKTNYYIWLQNNKKIKFNVGEGDVTSAVETQRTIDEENRWYHVVAVRSGSSGKKYIYIDGVLEGTHDNSTTPRYFDDNFGIGNHNKAYESPRYPFHGRIDDVRVYTQRLTDEEIEQLYTEGGWNGS
jgi:hypothetical protein